MNIIAILTWIKFCIFYLLLILAEESSLRSATIKSQYESRINKLEKELAEVKGRGGSQGDDPQQEKLQKENAELQQKVRLTKQNDSKA